MFPFAIGICYRRSVVRDMAPRKTMIVSRSYGSSVSTLEPFTKPAIPVRRHTIKVNPESRTSRSTLQDLCRCQVRGTQPRHPVMPHEMHDWWRFQVFWWKRSRVLSIWWSWYIAMVECVPSAQQTGHLARRGTRAHHVCVYGPLLPSDVDLAAAIDKGSPRTSSSQGLTN
jgi:hypothetical protein